MSETVRHQTPRTGLISWAGYIRDLVAQQGDQQHLAIRLDVDESRISKWIHGSIPAPRYVHQVATKLEEPLPLLACIAYGWPLVDMAANGGGQLLAMVEGGGDPSGQVFTDGRAQHPSQQRPRPRGLPTAWR